MRRAESFESDCCGGSNCGEKRPDSLTLIDDIDNQIDKLVTMISSLERNLNPILKGSTPEGASPDKNPCTERKIESPLIESLRATKSKIMDTQARIADITGRLHL